MRMPSYARSRPARKAALSLGAHATEVQVHGIGVQRALRSPCFGRNELVFSVAFDLPAIGIAEPGAASGGQWRMGSGGKQNCPVHKGAELDQLDVEKSRGDQRQLMKVLVGLSGVVSFQHKDDAARNGGRVSFAKQTG